MLVHQVLLLMLFQQGLLLMLDQQGLLLTADVGSSEVLVGTKVKGKKVEKGLKEKQKIKLEETKSSNEGENLKSRVYRTLHSRMSPSSIVQVIEKCSENQLKAIRAIGFGSMEFLKR